MEQPDPTQLRVSDADRHKVAEMLRQAAGEGRIDLDELDERLGAAYGAKTYAELAPLTSDLPTSVGPRSVPVPHARNEVVAGPAQEHTVAIMSGVTRRGVWVVPESFTIFTVMGGAELDMREAKFAAPEVAVTVNALMGGADITVNPHTHVVMEGVGIMGGFDGPHHDDVADLDETSPVVRVRGVAVMGGVSVRRKPSRADQPHRRLGQR
jgi:transketolase C-terminal domain/subunit